MDPGGAGAEPWRTGQGQRAGPGRSGNPEVHGPPVSVSLPHPVLLTVPKSCGLQRSEQLAADVLAVPARFSQALGHCEVKGAQIIAGVRVRSRVAIRQRAAFMSVVSVAVKK